MRVPIAKICVPTDFSDRAEHAVHYGAALAHQHGAALHLLHVLEDAHGLVHHPDFSAHGDLARAYFNRLEQEAVGQTDSPSAGSGDQSEDLTTHQFLKTLEEEVAGRIEAVEQPWWEGLDVQRVVRYGHPVEEICRYANKNSVDLIVMGSHGRTGLPKVLLGSVTERVLGLSPCPVLVLRHPDHNYTVVE